MARAKQLLTYNLITFGLAVFLAFNFTPTVSAASFTVTKTADTNDGACDADCSLREAITAANALPGADTIILPASTYTLSLAGTGEDANATGDLDITDDLTLNGAGAASTFIDGDDIDRVIEVRPGAAVNIDAVTVKDGDPGANAGGILNRATLTLTHSVITSNTGLDFGGGLFNFGTLTLIDTTVDDNDTIGPNLSGGGGGIFNQGTLNLTATTVSANTTLGRGGGIYNLDQTATFTNTTISGNTGLNGGGIFNRFGTLNLTHTTTTDNTATDNAGGVWNFGGSTNLTNTIVAVNSAATASDDCAGAMTSLGYNLASDFSCALAGTGDLNNTNPLLGPLANNGGPTQTHALLPLSPALDAVPLASCILATDQRGVPRPQGIACDIGAFELPVLTIDIKPGSYPNSINSKSKGTIPVAILSTPGFDAPNQVDQTSLTFGHSGTETSLAFCSPSPEDVNADGFPDLVCHFSTLNCGFIVGDTQGILKGSTIGGIPIEGRDSVRIVR
ncbi:MAG: CSLREA domain-containing protein [Candidatus Chisholmbacteria bacterium]|nr:CSLREA domain-containing protein [Candidatus Chisholmbacteria bacterium]